MEMEQTTNKIEENTLNNSSEALQIKQINQSLLMNEPNNHEQNKSYLSHGQFLKGRSNQKQEDSQYKQKLVLCSLQLTNKNLYEFTQKYFTNNKQFLLSYFKILKNKVLNNISNEELQKFDINKVEFVSQTMKLKQGSVLVNKIYSDCCQVDYQLFISEFKIKIKVSIQDSYFVDRINYQKIGKNYYRKTKEQNSLIKIIYFNRCQANRYDVKKAIRQIGIEKLFSAFKIAPQFRKIQDDIDVVIYDDCAAYSTEAFNPIFFSKNLILEVINNEKEIQKQKQKINQDLKQALLTIHSLKLFYQKTMAQNIVFSPQYNKYVLIDFELTKLIKGINKSSNECYKSFNFLSENMHNYCKRQPNVFQSRVILYDVCGSIRTMAYLQNNLKYQLCFDQTEIQVRIGYLNKQKICSKQKIDVQAIELSRQIQFLQLVQGYNYFNDILPFDSRIRHVCLEKNKQYFYVEARKLQLEIEEQEWQNQLYISKQLLQKRMLFLKSYLFQLDETKQFDIDIIKQYKYFVLTKKQRIRQNSIRQMNIVFQNLLNFRTRKNITQIIENQFVSIIKEIVDFEINPDFQKKVKKDNELMRIVQQIRRFSNTYTNSQNSKILQNIILLCLYKSFWNCHIESVEVLSILQVSKTNINIWKNQQNSEYSTFKFVVQALLCYLFIHKCTGLFTKISEKQIRSLLVEADKILKENVTFCNTIQSFHLDWLKTILFLEKPDSFITIFGQIQNQRQPILPTNQQTLQKIKNYFGQQNIYSLQIYISLLTGKLDDIGVYKVSQRQNENVGGKMEIFLFQLSPYLISILNILENVHDYNSVKRLKQATLEDPVLRILFDYSTQQIGSMIISCLNHYKKITELSLSQPKNLQEVNKSDLQQLIKAIFLTSKQMRFFKPLYLCKDNKYQLDILPSDILFRELLKLWKHNNMFISLPCLKPSQPERVIPRSRYNCSYYSDDNDDDDYDLIY